MLLCFAGILQVCSGSQSTHSEHLWAVHHRATEWYQHESVCTRAGCDPGTKPACFYPDTGALFCLMPEFTVVVDFPAVQLSDLNVLQPFLVVIYMTIFCHCYCSMECCGTVHGSWPTTACCFWLGNKNHRQWLMEGREFKFGFCLQWGWGGSVAVAVLGEALLPLLWGNLGRCTECSWPAVVCLVCYSHLKETGFGLCFSKRREHLWKAATWDARRGTRRWGERSPARLDAWLPSEAAKKDASFSI